MTQALAIQPNAMTEIVSSLVLNGDISKLNPQQKITYYREYCQRIGLDPATQPFKILKLQGKETLYCDRSGVAQLSNSRHVSHTIMERRNEDGIYSVVARAATAERQTESIGAVSVGGLKGDALCNAMMKAETKAKRRATLDLLGLGILDESEIETIPGAAVATIDAPAKADPPKAIPAPVKVQPAAHTEVDHTHYEPITGDYPPDQDEPADDRPVLTGIVEMVDLREGKTGNRPWKVWKVTLTTGDVVGTFDEAIGMDIVTGSKYEFLWEKDKRGNKKIIEYKKLQREPGEDQ